MSLWRIVWPKRAAHWISVLTTFSIGLNCSWTCLHCRFPSQKGFIILFCMRFSISSGQHSTCDRDSAYCPESVGPSRKSCFYFSSLVSPGAQLSCSPSELTARPQGPLFVLSRCTWTEGAALFWDSRWNRLWRWSSSIFFEVGERRKRRQELSF